MANQAFTKTKAEREQIQIAGSVKIIIAKIAICKKPSYYREMKSLLTIILLVATTGGFAQDTFNYQNDFNNILARTKDRKDKLAYNKLLTRYAALDTTLTDFEVLALLIGFTDKPDYNPYNLNTETEIWALYEKSKYDKAISLGKKFLKTNPFSIKALFGVAYSYQQLNQPANARSYAYQVLRIFQAMRFSGNGTTPNTPIFALGPIDGQDYINKFVIGNIGSMGSGSDSTGKFLDILTAQFEDGKTTTYYFIIDHAFKKMSFGKELDKLLPPQ